MYSEDLRLVGFIVGIVFAIIGAGLALGFALDAVHCAGFGRATGHETRYHLACYVKVGDRWVPLDYVYGNAVELRKEGR